MYCVLNMGWTPSQFTNLSIKERDFVAACVELKIEEEKKESQKIKARNSRTPSRARRR